MTSCAACPFDYDSVAVPQIADELRGYPQAFRAAFSDAGAADAARRPAPDVWSPLEYACHVRDVLLVQRDRAIRALVEERPAMARMQRDERVALCHYSSQPLAEVLDQLEVATRLLLLVFDGLGVAQWSRPLLYFGPGDQEETVAWMGRHTVHECLHHLRDVAAGLSS